MGRSSWGLIWQVVRLIRLGKSRGSPNTPLGAGLPQIVQKIKVSGKLRPEFHNMYLPHGNYRVLEQDQVRDQDKVLCVCVGVCVCVCARRCVSTTCVCSQSVALIRKFCPMHRFLSLPQIESIFFPPTYLELPVFACLSDCEMKSGNFSRFSLYVNEALICSWADAVMRPMLPALSRLAPVKQPLWKWLGTVGRPGTRENEYLTPSPPLNKAACTLLWGGGLGVWDIFGWQI